MQPSPMTILGTSPRLGRRSAKTNPLAMVTRDPIATALGLLTCRPRVSWDLLPKACRRHPHRRRVRPTCHARTASLRHLVVTEVTAGLELSGRSPAQRFNVSSENNLVSYCSDGTLFILMLSDCSELLPVYQPNFPRKTCSPSPWNF